MTSPLDRRSLFKGLGVLAGTLALPSSSSWLLGPAGGLHEVSKEWPPYDLSDPEVVRVWNQVLEYEASRMDPLFDRRF